MRYFFIIVAVGVLGCGCQVYRQRVDGVVASSEPGVYSVQNSIAYTTKPDTARRADWFLPETDGPHPVVLVIHGGAWTRGSRQQMTSQCERFAARGYAVLNISYRFAPRYRWPAQLEDAKAALRWIQSHASEYNLDLSRVGAYGYSAGAQMALMLAYDKQTNGIAAVAGGGSSVDFTAWPKSESITDLIGHPMETHEELWRAASPIGLVRPKLPPTYLYHGYLDWIVDVDQSRLLVRALERNGVAVEYDEKVFGHVATFLFDAEEIENVIRFFDRNMQ